LGEHITEGVRLTDEQRLDWLRLIRSENVGPRGIMAQTPQALETIRS
jgi:gluconate kinase